LLIALLGAAVSVSPLKALSLPVATLGLVGAAMTAIAKNKDCSARAAQNRAAVAFCLSGSNGVMANLAQNAVTPIHKMTLQLPALLRSNIVFWVRLTRSVK